MMKFTWKTKFRDSKVILKISRRPPAYFLWVRPAANVLPVTADGKILVMHEFKAAIKRWIWGFPGGMIEDGESAAQAAKRECEEELGLKVSNVTKIAEVKTDFPKTSVTYFLGYHLQKTRGKGWEKIGTVKSVSARQLYRLALTGQIHDPRMVVAILYLMQLLKRGKISLVDKHS